MQYYYNPFEQPSTPPQPPMPPQPPIPPQPNYNEQWYMMEQKRLRKNYEKSEIRKFSLGLGIAIIAYLVIQSILSGILAIFGLAQGLLEDPIFLYGFSIIGVSFLSVAFPFGMVGLYFKNKGQYKYPIIPSKKINFSKLVAWVLFGMLCCIGAQLAVSYIVEIVYLITGKTLEAPEYAKSNTVFALVLEFIGTAIVPAICEEFAMRCCSLQLLRKYGKGFAVFAVSIVFGLLHANLVQFFFAFTVGLILGFVTVMTDSILPAVLIHGINNGMSCVSSVVEFYSNEDAADVATIFMYIIFAVIGAVAAIYLMRTKQFKRNTVTNKDNTILSFGERMSAFLFPWMIIPFIILIVLTFANSL